ncbi:hypothetical protein [Tenacibaculum sp. IB213877]|uniref:hypothetical protein n=1 Tax=Tenacibaculum sp. IB213877 TaxID=3097351 RepID=UPI002A5A37D2|nr:hypothetical protein [Tenacibaculum sp. IB213877]MDY0781531.1 hypothetical protein [Tenacibaculum sp. IB213877]
MTKYLLLPLLTVFFIGCNTPNKSEFTYFGGKIINPKGEYVVLFDNDKVIDSIKLAPDNTFMGKFKGITPNLYYFKHGPEHQFVYLEPNDSLLIRLNTWDFDESLVFSGVNADRNNALIETFLQNEVDHRNFYPYYSLPVKEFKQKIDSTQQQKIAFLADYKKENKETSEDFLSVLEIALTYPLYSKLEKFIIDNSQKKTPELITDDFTNHRKIASINKDSLMFFGAYAEYVNSNLYSEVYQKISINKKEDFTVNLLNDINTKITSEELKNKLLRRATIRHFYDKSSCSINQQAFDTFLKLSTNTEDKDVIKKLLNDINSVTTSHKIPSFTLMGPEGALEKVEDLIKNKKTVIYFRNKKYSSDDWVAARINYLIKNNPKTKFLVINIHNNKQYITNLDIKNQYYLNDSSKAHAFLTSEFPRIILVNEKGIVKNGFGALSSEKINQQITDL